MKARRIDKANEEFWAALLQGQSPESSWSQYESAMKLVRAMGFQYRSTSDLLHAPLPELVSRINVAHENKTVAPVVHAALGGVKEPPVTFDDMLKIYRRNMQVALSGLSANQLRKHNNGRERAIESLKSVLGNLTLDAITKDDVLQYRDHWAARVMAREISADTAAREFSNIKGLFSAVDDELKTTYSLLWKDLRIKRRGQKQKSRTRPPYPTPFIQDCLLDPAALNGLNREGRLIIYAMVETGLRLSEACNLRATDVFLNAPIPYLSIQEREDRQQKTAYSIRTIPLVGVSLWAIKQAPNGFPRYRDKEDSASAAINKYLKENGLRPTEKHTIYSLRHSFQDRILAAGAPDRLQTDLMGHEFERESYGQGSSMEMKLELLNKIKLNWDENTKLAA